MHGRACLAGARGGDKVGWVICVKEELAELLFNELGEEVPPWHEEAPEVRGENRDGEGRRNGHVVAGASLGVAHCREDVVRELEALENPAADDLLGVDVAGGER